MVAAAPQIPTTQTYHHYRNNDRCQYNKLLFDPLSPASISPTKPITKITPSHQSLQILSKNHPVWTTSEQPQLQPILSPIHITKKYTNCFQIQLFFASTGQWVFFSVLGSSRCQVTIESLEDYAVLERLWSFVVSDWSSVQVCEELQRCIFRGRFIDSHHPNHKKNTQKTRWNTTRMFS